jgi:predicted acylesterase/phospholipase RssA
VDLVLSSGFLAFARHCGFLRAVEESGLEVDGLCGTSSGALVGAMWAAGIAALDIAEKLSSQRPFTLLRPSFRPWRGLFSLRALQGLAAGWLPPSFADLPYPLAVGVMAADGSGTLLSEGTLPEAVVASCAVPYLFAPVQVDGVPYRDGGAVDRLALEPWAQLRGERPRVVHLVERSAGAETAVPDGIAVVRTPRSGASFWSLGDFDAQVDEARLLTHAVLEAGLLEPGAQPSVGGSPAAVPLPPTPTGPSS